MVLAAGEWCVDCGEWCWLLVSGVWCWLLVSCVWIVVSGVVCCEIHVAVPTIPLLIGHSCESILSQFSSDLAVSV